MTDQYVKQHVVPKRYLQRFAEPGRKKRRYIIGVRQVKEGNVRLFTKAIDDVAYVKNYYDDERLEDPKHWEHFLAEEYESLYAGDIERIISRTLLTSDGVKVLTYEDKLLIGKLIIIQLLRVPGFLERLQQYGEKTGIDTKKNVYRKYRGKLSSVQRTAIDRLCLSRNGIWNILMNVVTAPDRTEAYAKVIAENVMNVIYNSTSIPFCTSDNPVILYNVLANSFHYGAGKLDSSNTLVMYPLSANVMIQVCYRGLFIEDDVGFDGRRIIISENEIGYIMKVNDLQMRHALQETYFPPGFIELVKRM